jgi:hypothetical protein
MSTLSVEHGRRGALRALPPLALDTSLIPALARPDPPILTFGLPDGGQGQLPGHVWSRPDMWAASERRVRLGAPPAIEIRRLTRKESNVLAAAWHPLGAETRKFGYHAFALFVKGEPLALATAGSTHGPIVDTQHGLFRRNVIELTRLCRAPDRKAEGLLRVMLRIWRDFLALPYWPYFPETPKVALVSYSMPGKAGQVYRFDGWLRLRACRGSGGGGNWSSPSRTGSRPEALWAYLLNGDTPAVAAAGARSAQTSPSSSCAESPVAHGATA